MLIRLIRKDAKNIAILITLAMWPRMSIETDNNLKKMLAIVRLHE